jgi:phosphohistidine phosphatase
MKELILVRHGKSSWDYDVSDRDRPLKERGIRDGHLMAEALLPTFVKPDAVFSSPANRALHTCTIMMRELGLPPVLLTISNQLYDFSGSMMKEFVHNLEDSLGRVMLFGHNHAITNIANAWGNTYIPNVGTTGYVHLEFGVAHWADIQFGKTRRVLLPKELK